MKRTTLLDLTTLFFYALCTLLIASTFSLPAMAQDAPPPQQSDADAPALGFDVLHATAAQSTQQAWSMLTAAVGDAKHPDLRIQALAALGTMGSNPRSVKMITTALSDPDVDVRTAAVLAAGQTKSRGLATTLRASLDDKEPEVAFAAAVTLSKMGDRSGEDILMAVMDGDRKASASMMNGAMHTMNKNFRDPSALAKMGALQGASMLLGPFGFGITALEYIRKSGGQTARVTAIEELAKVKTNPIRKELIAALADKDPGVRAAAAKALGEYHDKAAADALLNVFSDPKTPVRLTAAASYLRSTSVASTPKTEAK